MALQHSGAGQISVLHSGKLKTSAFLNLLAKNYKIVSSN